MCENEVEQIFVPQREKLCQDSSVGIATRYWLDGQRIKFRWGRDSPHPPRPALGPTQLPVLRVQRPGPDVDRTPLSSAEVSERAELYPRRLFMAGYGVNFTFSFTLAIEGLRRA